jgi:DNA recombination protein RmuC
MNNWPVGILIAVAFVAGGLLIAIIGWLVRRQSRGTLALANSRDDLIHGQEALVAELRQQITQRDEKQRMLEGQLLTLNQRNGELGAEAKSLTERLATERQQLETIQEKFRKEFETISTKLIADNTSNFNRQSTESLENLLKPLKEKLGEFKVSLDKTHDATTTNSALLKEQVSRIGAEAANLSKALKGDVKVLGNWGENMLDQILEKSGLQREFHYHRQRGAKDVEGDQRFLDVIVDLPEKRNLVIDSKVSLRAYEESVNAADDPAKFAGLDRHVEALRKHFRDLGAKRYQDIHGINTPDFVLMYVPIEAAFFAAIAREPGLFAEALDHNVVLITNSTLLATLRTVAHVWRLADQQKHVLEIADRGGKLYDKFVGFVEDLQAVGDALGKARKAWEDASTKLHTGSGNLISQTAKLKQLGAKAAKSLPNALLEKASEEPPPLDTTLRLPPNSGL